MKSIAILLVGSALALGANAGTVSYNFSNALQTTDFAQTGSLGLFDTSLGTLTGASITVNGAAISSFTSTNLGAQSQTATVTSIAELFWGSSLSALVSFLSDSVLMSATSGSQSYAAGEAKSFGPFSLSGSNSDDLSTILSALQTPGGGTFDVTCESSTGLAIQGGGGNIAISPTTSAACGAGIVYTYDAKNQIPEPATVALVGLGLLGLVTSRRRVKKAQ